MVRKGTVNFTVANANNLLLNNPTFAAFSTLAGPSVEGACKGGGQNCTLEWGLPFFYGRTVFTAIEGQAVPSTAPPAPWWAYTIGFVAP